MCLKKKRKTDAFHAAVGASIQDGTAVQLDKIIQHVEYDSKTIVNNVALNRTVEEIIFTNLIQPVANKRSAY